MTGGEFEPGETVAFVQAIESGWSGMILTRVAPERYAVRVWTGEELYTDEFRGFELTRVKRAEAASAAAECNVIDLAEVKARGAA